MRCSCWALLLLSCSIPDADDIRLSECMRECSAEADVCIAAAEVQCIAAESRGEKCDRQDYIACGRYMLDCVAGCIEEAERVLQQ